MQTISFKLKPIEPVEQFDTGRDTPEGDQVTALERMEEVVKANPERFQDISVWDFEGMPPSEHAKVTLGVEANPNRFEWVNDLFDKVVSKMADAGYSCWFDGEANSFFIYDGPTGEDDDDHYIEEDRNGWSFYRPEGTITTKGGRDALIVLAFEEMDEQGYYPNVIVRDQHDNMWLVTEYTNT